MTLVVVTEAAAALARLLRLIWSHTDPRTAHLPIVTNPIPLISIIGVYLIFVYSWGPKFMRDRKAYDLKNVMIVYNVMQMVACIFLFIRGLEHGWGGRYSFLCEPLDATTNPATLAAAITTYQYFLLKVVDLLDTVFMVLRKNLRQVTFLHVYHHAGMVFACYLAVKFHPGGHCTLLGLNNCIVHTVMYGYYLACLLDPRYKTVWWKKYITLLQITQFGINAVHNVLPFLQPNCGVNRYISGVLVPQNLFMFALFSDFYWKTYYVRRGPNGEQRAKAE